MLKKYFIASLLVVIVFVLFLVARSIPKDSEDSTVQPEPRLDTIRVGYLPLSASLAFFVADKEGLFDKYGVPIESIPFENGLQLADALINQQIDATSVGPGDVFLSRNIQDPDKFKIYMHTAYSENNPIYSIIVPKNSSITSTEDLFGKNISVFPGTTNSMLFSLAMKNRHGSGDLKLVGVPAGQQLDTLRSGLYDALVALEPIGTIANTSEDLKVLEWGIIEKEVLKPLPITTQVLSIDAINTKKESVKRFVNAMEDAVFLIESNRDAYSDILIEKMHLTEKQAKETFTGDYITLDAIEDARFQEFANILTEQSVLSASVDVSNLYYAKD